MPSAESNKPEPVGFKKGGWASISSVTPEPPSFTESPLARSAASGRLWVPLQSHLIPPSPASDAISSAGFPTTTPVMSSQLGYPSITYFTRTNRRSPRRTGGWSSIDSTTGASPPPTWLVPTSAIVNVHRQLGYLPSGPASIKSSALETVPAHVLPPVPPDSQTFTNPNRPPNRIKESEDKM